MAGEPNKMPKLVQPVTYCSNGNDDVTVAIIAVRVFNNGHMTSMRVTTMSIFNNEQHEAMQLLLKTTLQ